VLGDVDVAGIPGNWIVSAATLVGAVCGFMALMWFVWKGRPQAGLPLLNSGAFMGYLISVLVVYQKFGINWFGTVI
jgi:presenilin-like A22 family membrane protease